MHGKKKAEFLKYFERETFTRQIGKPMSLVTYAWLLLL